MTKWNATRINFPGVMLMFMTLMLSGCVTPFWGGYGENGQTKEEFTRYVEKVFRLQNSLTSEIMELPETDETDNHEALLQAEQSMQEACGPLNEYASREKDDLNIGLLLRRRVQKSAMDCEQAAQKVQSLLKR